MISSLSFINYFGTKISETILCYNKKVMARLATRQWFWTTCIHQQNSTKKATIPGKYIQVLKIPHLNYPHSNYPHS